MKTFSLCTLLLFCTLSTYAQDRWEDYIMGRPMQGYAEAKEATAKRWGLEYKAVFGGCVVSEATQKTQKSAQTNNQLYFESVEKRYGNDWLDAFKLDVRIEMNRTIYANDSAVWIEILQKEQDSAYLDSKKAIAQKWGIRYQAFLLRAQNGQLAAELQDLNIDESDRYLRRLDSRLGEQWSAAFSKEVSLERAKRKAVPVDSANLETRSGLAWVDAVVGRPFMPLFEARKAVAATWKIAYVAQFMGCSPSTKHRQTLQKAQKSNQQYFQSISKRYGSDWRRLFDRAVEQKMVQLQAVVN